MKLSTAKYGLLALAKLRPDGVWEIRWEGNKRE